MDRIKKVLSHRIYVENSISQSDKESPIVKSPWDKVWFGAQPSSSSSIMESSQISITFQFVKLSREWSGQNNVQWPFIKIFHRQKWHHWTKLRFLGRNKITWHSDFSHSDFMREQWQIQKKTEKQWPTDQWSGVISFETGAPGHLDYTLIAQKLYAFFVYVYLDIYGNPENYKSILWRLFSEEGKEWPKIFFLVTMQRTPRGSLYWKYLGKYQATN